MSAAQVFIDDAVRGRLPDVCVKAGGSAGGSKLTIRQEIGRSNRLGILWLLAFAGPFGWILLLFLAGRDHGEQLTVTLPWSEAAYEHLRAVKRARTQMLIGLFAAAAALLVVGAYTQVGALLIAGAVLLVVGAVAGVVGESRVDKAGVNLDLDASRRWLTIRGVHPDFVEACAAHEATADRRG